VTAFTKDGIGRLQQIIADERATRRAPPQVKPTAEPRLSQPQRVADAPHQNE
jgi:hypothetical protein